MKYSEKCIICGNKKIKKLQAKVANFLKARMFENFNVKTDLIYCPKCNIFYSSIRPENFEVKRYYQGYFSTNYINERTLYEPDFPKIVKIIQSMSDMDNKNKKANLYQLLKNNINLSKIKNILDFGGAKGGMIPEQLYDKQLYVYDIDSSEPLPNITKIRKEDLKKIKWDIITCSQMLEHDSYPIDTINLLIDILPRGGYLEIDVPFEKVNLTLQNQNENHVIIHEHINYFRLKTFEKIFKSSQFAIIYNSTIDSYKWAKSIGQESTIYCLVKKLTIWEQLIGIKHYYKLKKFILKDLKNNLKKINLLINLYT